MSNATVSSLVASWDQRDAEERERLVRSPKALDLLCEINEVLVSKGPTAILSMPPKILEVIHAAAIERLSVLTLSAIARGEE